MKLDVRQIVLSPWRWLLGMIAGILLALLVGLFVGCGTTMQNTAGSANTYCDHGNRVYQYSGIAVVPQDPSCKTS